MNESKPRYAAFISYRHGGEDARWAKWLHRALESWRIPKRLAGSVEGRRRIGRVFRDEEELAASPNLSESIVEAMRASEFLIVICSPRTVESEWVDREVQQFREWGRHNQILSLLIDGEPKTAFPKSLKELRRTTTHDSKTPQSTLAQREAVETVEPLAADVRVALGLAGRSGRKLAFLRIVATLLGVSFDELRQREQQRQVRRLTVTIFTVTVLATVLAGLAGFAWLQKLEADTQRGIAVQQTGEAKYQRGVAQDLQKVAENESQRAESRLNTLRLRTGFERADADDLTAALPWFVEALRQEQGKPDRADIHRLRVETTLAECPTLMQCLNTSTAKTDPRMQRTAVIRDGVAEILDLRTKQRIGLPLQHSSVRSVFWSPDGELVATVGDGVRLHNSRTCQPIGPAQLESFSCGDLVFTNDGKKVLVREKGWPPPGRGRWLDTANGNEISWLPDVFADRKNSALRVWETNGQQIVSVVETFQPRTWEVTIHQISPPKLQQTLTIPFEHAGIEQAAISEDGNVVALVISDKGTLDRFAQCWSVLKGEPSGPRQTAPGGVANIDLSPDGRHLVLTTRSELGAMQGRRTLPQETRVHSVSSGDMQGLPCYHTDGLDRAFFDPSGAFFVTQGATECRVWETITAEPHTPPLRHRGGLRTVHFDDTGRFLVTAGDGSLRVWDLAQTRARIPLTIDYGTVSSNPYFTQVRYVADGEFAVTNGFGRARLWRTADGQFHRELNAGPLTDFMVQHVDGNPAHLLTGIVGTQGNRTVKAQVFDAATGQTIGPEMTSAAAEGDFVRFDPVIKIDPAQSRYAVSRHDGSIGLYEVTTGRVVTESLPHASRASVIEFSPDGQVVVTGSEGGNIQLWQTSNGEPVGESYDAGSAVIHLQFGHDQFFLAAITSGFSDNGRLCLWLDDELDEPDVSLEYSVGLLAFAVSPDETRFATGTTDGRARLWKLNEDRTALVATTPVLEHPGRISAVAFDASGRLLLTGGGDPPPAWTNGFARIWHVENGLPVTPWITQRLKVTDVAFHPQRLDWAVVGDDAGYVTSRGDWNLSLSQLLALAELTADAHIDSTGGMVPLPDDRRRRNVTQLAAVLSGEGWKIADQRARIWHQEQARRWEDASEWAFALRHLDSLIEEDPTNAILHVRRARAHYRLGHWRQAIADSSQAIALGQKSTEVFYFRGSSHAALREWSKAEKDCRRVIDPANIDRPLIINQATADYLLELASVQAEQGKRQETLETLLHLNLAGQWFRLEEYAKSWEQRGRLWSAVAACDRLLYEMAGSARLLRRRARLLEQLGQIAEARQDFDTILTRDSQNSEDWQKRAELSMRLEDWSAAANDFEQAVNRNSTQLSAWIGWALTPLISEDIDTHRTRCRQLLPVAQQAASRQRMTLTLCLIADPSTASELDLRPLADALAADYQASPNHELGIVLSALQQRIGNSEEAIAKLRSLVRKGGTASDREFGRSFLALAYADQNDSAAGSAVLNESALSDAMLADQNWWWAWLLQSSRQEAVAACKNARKSSQIQAP